MLTLLALIDFLHMKVSSKYFNNFTNIINKERKPQRLISLKKEEIKWNFEEKERESQRRVCASEFLETNIF